MLIPHVDYPVRPSMETGESLGGYICRFQGTNGHWIPPALHDALRAMYHGLPDKAPAAFELVQSIVGPEILLDREWWLGRSLITNRAGGHMIAWPTLNYRSPQFCPSCLEEYGFHFGLWEFPLIRACPVHRCALVGICTECSQSLTWARISPNWSCRCGKPIREMSATAAPSSTAGLARLIAFSNDVNLPFGFRCRMGDSEFDAYQSQALYGALDWLRNHRHLMQQPKNANDDWPGAVRRVARRPSAGSWEAKILSDSPETLSCRLRKVVSRRLAAGARKLACLSRSDGFVQGLLSVVDDPQCPSPFKEKIVTAVSQFLETYRLNLPTRSFVFFDPRPTDKQRIAQQLAFAEWWAVLTSRMAPWNGDSPPPKQNTAGFLIIGSRLADVQICEVLQVLLESAQKEIGSDCFGGLSRRWCVPDRLRKIERPENALIAVGNHLASLSRSELSFVHELVMTDYQKWPSK